jgi:hypothetical protein
VIEPTEDQAMRLTRYTKTIKRSRSPRLTTERVRIIDPDFNEIGEPISVYWEGTMPLDELLKFDPQARCRTTRIPRRKRLAAWWLSPSFAILLTFAAIFLNAPDPLIGLPLAIFGGVFAGLPVGLGLAWVIIKRWLPIEAWWNIMRIPTADAMEHKLTPREEGDAYVLTGIVPRPLMAQVDDDSKEMEAEIQTTLWQNEILKLGVEGFATRNFLTGLGAARAREELLKAGVTNNRPTLEKPGPDQRGMPH